MTGMMTSPSVKAERTSSKEEIKVWVYYKNFCTWGHLTNCRWLKILILNYLTSPGHLKSFFSVSYFSNVKTNLELFFSPRLYFLVFCSPAHSFVLLPETFCFTSSSQFFFQACHISQSQEKNLCSPLRNLSPKLHIFWDTGEYWGY